MSDEQSVVYRTQNVMEAQSVKDILSAEGVKAFVFDDHLLSLNPLLGHALGGIKIAVHTKDYPRAERTLRKVLKTGKAKHFTGSISPIGQTTAGNDAIQPTDIRGLWVILAFVLFIGALFFFSPGRIAVILHRTIPDLFTRPRNVPQLNTFPSEARAAITQPLNDLLKKAQAGDLESQYYLGWKYYFGDGTEKSDTLAVQWIQKAAEGGFRKAVYTMGTLWYYGVGVTKDYGKAFRWYLKAAQQGYPVAQMTVGALYRSGRGIERDDSIAFSWFQKAADQGYAPAQDWVGWAYAQGQDVPQDDGKAVDWYKKSASQGNARGEAHLAYCYLVGLGVEKDYKQAAALFEKAALQGDPSAQYNLGTLYEDGRGVLKNVVHAYAWLTVAASYKHAKAIEASTDWEGRLSKDEIEAGHSLAADYEKQIGHRPNDEREDRLKPQ